MPLTMPFMLSLPNGPASNVFGGAALSGPVIEGVGSGVGAGDGVAWPTGFCWSGVCVGGAFWAAQIEANPRQRQIATRFFGK